MSTSEDFYPRQRGDREQQKFGADNVANAPSTLVFLQVGGKVQDGAYSDGDAAILNLDASGRLKVTGSVEIVIGSTETYVDADRRLWVAGSNKVVLRGIDGTNIGVDGDNRLQVAGSNKVVLMGADGTDIATSDGKLKVYITDGTDDALVSDDGKLQVTGTTKLVANSGVDIGDVDVASIAGGTNIIGKVYISDGTDDVLIDGDKRLLVAGSNRVVLQNIEGTEVGIDSANRLRVAGSNRIVGRDAHDAVITGDPVLLGAQMKDQDGTDPGTVSAEDDITNLKATEDGRLYVSTEHPRYFHNTTAWAGFAPTNSPITSAPGSGLSLYLTDIQISMANLSTTIRLVEDTSSAVTIVGNKAFAANGGMVSNLRTPIKLTANKDLGITCIDASQGSIDVSGYIAP